MKARAHCADCALEHRRRFLVAHFLQIAEHHNFAIMARQAQNSFANQRNRLDAAEIHRRNDEARMYAVSIAITVSIRRSASVSIVASVLRERDKQPVTVVAFVNVIPSDPEQVPGYASERGIESAAIPNQGHENLLGNVLGDRCISAHMHGKTVDRPLPAAIKEHKCALVSGENSPDQIVVRVSIGSNHLYQFDDLRRLSLHIPRRGSGSSKIIPLGRPSGRGLSLTDQVPAAIGPHAGRMNRSSGNVATFSRAKGTCRAIHSERHFARQN
jgi:hypothetical protein